MFPVLYIIITGDNTRKALKLRERVLDSPAQSYSQVCWCFIPRAGAHPLNSPPFLEILGGKEAPKLCLPASGPIPPVRVAGRMGVA